MKYFYLTGTIDKEIFQRFIDFCNGEPEKVTIVLDSGGGDTCIGQAIIYIINQIADATLIISYAYSVAFEIAFKTTCKKKITQACRGMYH